MQQVNLGLQSSTLELDVCRTCQLLWFDAGELNEMGDNLESSNELPLSDSTGPTNPPKSTLSPEAKQAIALIQVKAIAEVEERTRTGGDAHPLMWFVSIFGLPVELGTHWIDRVPVVTWTLAAIITLTSMIGFVDLAATVETWGFISEAPLRHGGLTLLTSFLLHGGWLHLLSNLYFLMVFGDNIEVQQGPLRLIGLLFVSTLVGDLLHLIALPASDIPAIGASGGIAGVMLAYAMLFPRAQLGILVFYFPRRIPIWLYIALWLIVQVLGTMTMSDESTIGYAAHLGGAVVGFVAGYLWRRRG